MPENSGQSTRLGSGFFVASAIMSSCSHVSISGCSPTLSHLLVIRNHHNLVLKMSTISTDKHSSGTMTAVERSFSEQTSDPDSLSPPRQSPFDPLATEIIQTIFKYACPIIFLPPNFECSNADIITFIPWARNYLDPKALGMVCKRWRAVSIAHHSLWATLHIDASRIYDTNWDQWGLSQVRDRLERSGGCPLKITVHSKEGDEDDGDDYAIAKILDLIILHSKRWHTIKFDFPLRPELLQKLGSLQDKLPLLESLDISLYRAPPDTPPPSPDNTINPAPFSFVPSLKCLDLRPVSGIGMEILRDMQIPWTQISDLTLNMSGLETKQDMYEIFSWLSVSLTDLTFWRPPPPLSTSWAIPNRRGPIVLPELRRLCLLVAITDILDTLVCPALEYLDIGEGDTHEIARFLDNLSGPLTHIRLSGIKAQGRYADTYECDELFQHSSLSRLTSLSLYTFKYRQPFLDLLVVDSRKFFPCLVTLRIDLDFTDSKSITPQYITSQFNALQRIIESRTCSTSLDHHNSSVNPFHHNAISSFKNYSIFLYLPRLEELGPNYAEIPLQKIRSCCEARNVRPYLEVWYAQEDSACH